MKVEEMMTVDVVDCRETDSLAQAVRAMEERDCGCVPVTSADGSRRLVGIITDRDVCLASYRADKPLSELRVRDAMTEDVSSCLADASLGEAEAVMRGARVRRVPVVDDQGILVGILSLADLAQEAEHERRLLHPSLGREEIGNTLAVICTPRSAG